MSELELRNPVAVRYLVTLLLLLALFVDIGLAQTEPWPASGQVSGSPFTHKVCGGIISPCCTDTQYQCTYTPDCCPGQVEGCHGKKLWQTRAGGTKCVESLAGSCYVYTLWYCCQFKMYDTDACDSFLDNCWLAIPNGCDPII